MKIYADEAWAKYVLQTFLRTYKIKNEKDISFSYGKDIDKIGIMILKGKKCEKNLIFEGYIIPIYHANNQQKLKGTTIAAYEDGTPAVTYHEKSKTVYLNADIIKTSFLMLSRAEEENSPKDEFGRFQAKYTINKDVTYPLVNVYFDLLLKLLGIVLEDDSKSVGTKNFWPDDAPYAVCLTHDVDNVYKWHLRKIISYVVKEQKIKELFSSIGKKEYWNFDTITSLEEQYGFRSTFFFLTTKRDLIPRYNIKRMKKVLHFLNKRGWEVGLHTGLYSYDDYNKLLNEKQTIENLLGEKISGVRNHYLRFNAPESWRIQQKSGFSYDSTIGFRETVGFRSGFCLPYYPYDFKTHKILNILELPMTVMDNAMFLYENPNKTFDELIETVKKFNGLLVVNWHQSVFDEKDYPEYTQMYKAMLERFKRDNAFVGTCKDVAEWWISH